MADEDFNSEEPLEGAENDAEGASLVEERPQHVTRPQWAAMFLLAGTLVYLYAIWPQTSSSRESLKDPQVYIEAGRQSFVAAHTDRAFPRDLRVNTFQDVDWQFAQARKAGGELELVDLFRWGYSTLQVAKVVYPGSHYAMVKPLELFEQARHKIKDIEEEYSKTMNVLEVQEALSKLSVHPAKINFALALAYLEVERVDKAIPLLEKLQELRLGYEQSRRLKGEAGSPVFSGLELGASPYLLQLRELNQVGWMLGKAYDLRDRKSDAVMALNAFLESTRKSGVSDNGMDREVRFQALSLLAKIHLEQVHLQEKLIRELRGQLQGGQTMLIAKQKRQDSLEGAYQRLKELYAPEFKVYGLQDQHLMFMETCVKLKKTDEALALAEDFDSADPHSRNEMKLWEVQALLQKNPSDLVIPTLHTIAGDNTRRHLRLAALVMMGDIQVSRDDEGQTLGVDKTLGILLEENKPRMYMPTMGAYEKAATLFEEKEFDENTMIDKFNLVEAFMKRAHLAEMKKDEDLAIRIYRFLLKEFTVQKASLIQGIAKLQRIKGRELVKKEGLSKEARHWFKISGESYLYTDDNTDVPYEKLAAEEALFQAAESFFEGGYYTRAYDVYAQFIKERPEDTRVTKARHKKGISALYRKEKDVEGNPLHDRFGDARQEFIINISQGIRPMDRGNGEISRNQLGPGEGEYLEQLLKNDELGTRDIWAYNSLLELGNAYYAEHKYDEASLVYSRIKRDGRFNPSSEIWRKAAYAFARLTWDRVSEQGDVAPWREAIVELEDLLMLYDLKTFNTRFSEEDKGLYQTFQRDNSHLKFLLSRSFLKLGDAVASAKHARELLENTKHFDLSIQEGNSEDTQLATVQKTEALLADALYDQGKFAEAMEHYRRAHDRHLDSAERPFYSLNIVDCLLGLGRKDKAIERLKQIKWEFKEFFRDDAVVFNDQPNLNKDGWLGMVNERIALLESSPASAVGN